MAESPRVRPDSAVASPLRRSIALPTGAVFFDGLRAVPNGSFGHFLSTGGMLSPKTAASVGLPAGASFSSDPGSFGIVAWLTRPPRRLMHNLLGRQHLYHPEWLPKGTDVAAVSNIIMATIGVGTLSMPYALAHMGLTTFLVVVALVTCLMVFSHHTACRVADITGVPAFELMAKALFGHRGELLVEVLLIAGSFGSSVAYVVIIGDIADMFGPLVAGDSYHPFAGRLLAQLTVYAVVMLPLCLLRTLSALKYASLVGVGATAVLVGGIVLRGLRFGESANITPLVASPSFVGVLGAVPLILFSFVNQVNCAQIYAELPTHTPTRFIRLSFPTMVVVALAYVAVALAGQAAVGPAVLGNVLKNFAVGSDGPLTAAFIAVAVKVFLTYPLIIYPVREAIFHMRGVADSAAVTTRGWVEATLVLTLSSVAVAVVIPKVTVLFSLLGAITGSFFAFTLPAALALKVPGFFETQPGAHFDRVLVWTMFSVGILSGVVGTVLSVGALIS